MPDSWDLPDGQTHAIAGCEPRCPPLDRWPYKNLVTGACPECGRYAIDGKKAARMLRARALASTTTEGNRDG